MPGGQAKRNEKLSDEQVKRSLQKQLASFRLGAEPRRPSTTWLRGGQYCNFGQVLIQGCSVVVGLRGGHVLVGDVEHCISGGITLALWGCDGPAKEIMLSNVRRVAIVGPHHWQDETEARRRQGAGLPALIETGKEKL